MLCDDILAVMGPTAVEAALRTGLSGRAARDLQEISASLTGSIAKAQRFVLSPLVKATADDLASPKVLDASRDHLFLPAERVWIEWHQDSTIMPGAGRMGVLLEAAHTFRPDLDYTLTMGRASIFLPAARGAAVPFRNLMGMFDFPTEGAALRFRDIVGIEGLDEEVAGAWVCAVLCLINTPRIAQVRPHDHTKLNKARARARKPPVLDWGEVHLTVDLGAPGRGDQTSPTELRALHHVRAHLRIRLGQVELVRPHYRGDPSAGIRLHRHVVSRVEDEPGEWKGGPLPAPRVLHELDDPDEPPTEPPPSPRFG
jgi:hypothetical protein